MTPTVASIILRRPLVSLDRLPGLELWLSTKDAADITVGGGTASIWHDISGKSAVNCLLVNGVTGNYASVARSAANTITGDLSCVVTLSLNDIAPVALSAFIAQLPASPQYNYEFFIGIGTGLLGFAYSTTGSNYIVKTCSATLASVGLTAQTIIYLGVFHDVDNGAAGNDVKFYWSTDKVTWTQLGTTVTTVGTVTRHASTGVIDIGGESAWGNVTDGRIYRAEVWAGDYFSGGATAAIDANFALVARGVASFTESSVNAATVTLVTTVATGARISGARDDYEGAA